MRFIIPLKYSAFRHLNLVIKTKLPLFLPHTQFVRNLFFTKRFNYVENPSEDTNKNHSLIGLKQKLFFFLEESPGSCFFTPQGYHIYNKLLEFVKFEQRKRNFVEVISPNIFSTELLKISGHYQHYSEDMFTFTTNDQKLALKPMNCPGHCLIFKHKKKNWFDLPIRMSEFGVLHRNESLGTLRGLTRVRRFTQDDAHIFCRQDQIRKEIDGILQYLKSMYKIFGFKVSLSLSTRPKNYLGELDQWNDAEKVLAETLDENVSNWTVNAEDGAFYGPKIDILLTDALNRTHQCATIQLDFQLPIQFDLSFIKEDASQEKPVIIHCAILGSFERMIAILAESCEGRWPFWLSPRQVLVIPVHSNFNQYAQNIVDKFKKANIIADTINDGRLKEKIKHGQTEAYSFMLIVGKKEAENNSANLRTINNKVYGEMKIDDILNKLIFLNETKEYNYENIFS